jgi:preprotein translocase subunit YajC
MNWTIVIIVSILALGLIFFLIIRNQKDEKDFEETLNNDFPKKPDQRGEIEEDFM